jgi:hypothetical protein
MRMFTFFWMKMINYYFCPSHHRMCPQWTILCFSVAYSWFLLIWPLNCLQFAPWYDNFFTVRSYLDLFLWQFFFLLETVWWAEGSGSSWADFASCFSRSRTSKSCEYAEFQCTLVYELVFCGSYMIPEKFLLGHNPK